MFVPGDKVEVIDLMLEGMEVTARTLEYLSQAEHILEIFPGEGPEQQLEELRQATLEMTTGYNDVINMLGGIPIRLCFGTDQETSANVIGFTRFVGGAWHCKYKVDDELADNELRASTAELRDVFWATLIPE